MNLSANLKVDQSIKLNRRTLMFMNGRVILEQGRIPCLVVESVTEADDLNIELYQKSVFLLKKLVIGDDNKAINAFKKYQQSQDGD